MLIRRWPVILLLAAAVLAWPSPAVLTAQQSGVPVAPGALIRQEPPLPAGQRITGVVILEVTIGVDGAVSDARVLRSIPQLDQAALDAVRQWRYEPMLLNGQPVPVIITVPIPFLLPPR